MGDIVNTEENIQQILIEDIIPNRFQPRLSFNEEGLKELSDSIKQHGIIQPLVLRRLGNKYEIIAGERRYKASIMAGLKTVPAIISNIDDNQSAAIALVENIQRRNLTSIEEAKSYKNLLDRGYLNQTQLAEKMGVSQSTIANKLRLLNLSDEVQKALLEEKISERHARSLLSLSKDEQNEWLKKIIAKRMTVRQLDLELKKLKNGDVEQMPVISNDSANIMSDIINNEDDESSVDSAPAVKSADVKAVDTPKVPNKFFNFLEDEAANMSMDVDNKEESNFKVDGNIEVLEDFDITPSDNTVYPFLFDDSSVSNNSIEEIVPKEDVNVVDPIDRINTLAPDYMDKQKEMEGMDLKTAINDIRDFVKTLENRGFVINLDEVDLANDYQIMINIKK